MASPDTATPALFHPECGVVYAKLAALGFPDAQPLMLRPTRRAAGAEAEGWPMDRQRPLRAWSRPWLIIAAAALLAACQGLPQSLSFSDEPPEAAAPGWRVVERLGEARYLAPSMAGWEEVAAGSLIPAGSQITTGIGGRLIVRHAANQVSAGTNSRFILPGWEPGDSVRQTAGWLRYRIATAPSATFGIETPFLDLMVDDAVLDVTVGDSETEVAVVSGRVRVKSLDERRQIDLHAGYTGYASLQDDPLMVRRGAGERLEAVPPIVVPALHPDRAASASLAPNPAGTSTAAALATAPTLVPRPAMAASPAEDGAIAAPAPDPAMPVMPAREAAASDPAASPLEAPLAQAPLARAPLTPSEAEHVEQIRRRFDLLTEGLLDGLLPALPSDPQRNGR
jgi:hypothetical protein